MFNFKQKQGFTLVELIIVITIIAVLASLAFMSLSGETAQARDSKRVSDLQTFENSIATSNGKNKPVHYKVDDINSRTNPNQEPLTTNSGELRPLRGAYLVPMSEDIFDSDVLPTVPRDPKGSRYLGAFLSKTDYQLFGTKENPSTQNPLAEVRGSFKEGMILDVLTDDINETETRIPVANPSRFVQGDIIKIDNEQMVVSVFNAVDGEIEVSRAYDGTTAKVHNKGASVKIKQFETGADSLVCLNSNIVLASDGTTPIDATHWQSIIDGNDFPGAVCEIPENTITNEGSNLPYLVTNE
jgi:prepilin-type N-terminal cleavage/methylation domain-containing protein